MNTQNESMTAKEYYKNLSMQGTAAMLAKKAKGEWMHKAPLGYLNARDKEGKSILMPDPKTYPLVQEMIRMRESGMSIRTIQREITARGLRSPHGKKLSVSMVYQVLNRLF